MLETYFSATKVLGHLRSGPSGPYLDGLAVVGEPAEPKYVPDVKTGPRELRTASYATTKLDARDAAGVMTELGSHPAGRRPNDIRGSSLAGTAKSGPGTIEKMTTSRRAFL